MRSRKKPKMIPKHMRERRRYAVVEIFSEGEISEEDAKTAIAHSLLEIAGEINTAVVNLKFVASKNGKLLIRFSHHGRELVHAAVLLVNRIGDSRVAMRISKVYGTIKSAKRKF